MDRDGTINEEVGYINHVCRFQLLSNSAAGIRLINKSDFKAIIITNQAGVARGYFPERLIHQVHEKMKHLLSIKGAYLDQIYYCPHHPSVGTEKYRMNCSCRKPKTGMLEKAAQELNIDLSRSYVIGDKYTEIVLGNNAGARSVLVLTGYGRGEYELFKNTWDHQPDFIAEDLLEAVQWIINQET